MAEKMAYERRREIAQELRAAGGEAALDVIQSYINMGGDTQLQKAIEAGLGDWHRTLQQCFMRGLIRPAILVLAKEGSDDRNRSTVRMCQEMLPILEEHTLPFI